MAATRIAAAVIVSLILQLAGGKDLYWQPNSNWNNPSNWALNQVPGCKDRADLSSVPVNSAIYLNTDAAVGSISLPANGRLILAPSVTIRLSSGDDCTVPGDTEPMAATVKNEFIGASNKYWECASNWITKDNSPAEHAPCGDDRAFFDSGSFSFVTANDSIFVRSLNIRGANIQSRMEITSAEFDLRSIMIEPDCATDPGLCPCPDDSLCPKPTTDTLKGPNVGGIAVGVVIGIIMLLIIIVVLVIIGVVLYVRFKPTARYVKDELLDEPELGTSSPPPPSSATPDLDGDKKLYDNPVFGEDEVKVDLGKEMDDVPEVGVTAEMNVYESNPPLFADTGEDEDSKKVPKLNEYERF